MIIELKKIIKGKNYPESGTLLFHKLDTALSNNEQINLNLIDVNSLPSMFLNVSLGEASKKYGIETIKKQIKFSNISKVQAIKLREYFYN